MIDFSFLNDWLADGGVGNPDLMASLILVLIGFVLLYLAGNLVVKAAVDLAEKIGVSRLLIGLVIVAFGTSSPELFISLLAVRDNAPSIAVGNVVGSNIANILLVLALAALISPIDFTSSSRGDRESSAIARRNIIYRDGTVMLIATGLLIVIGGYCGTELLREWCPAELVITFRMGLVFLGFLLLYIIFSYFTEKTGGGHANGGGRFEFWHWSRGLWVDLLVLILGFAGLYVGAEALILGAVDLAERVEVPRPVIAVSLVAFGTSVPELAAVGVAAYKRFPQVAFGGIVGSNIFNILAVLGITALIQPVAIAQEFVDFDFWVMLGAALLLMIFLWFGGRVTRLQALFMIALYAAYIAYLYTQYKPSVDVL